MYRYKLNITKLDLGNSYWINIILVLNLNYYVKCITYYLFKIADVVLNLTKKVFLRNKNVYKIYTKYIFIIYQMLNYKKLVVYDIKYMYID